MHTQPTLRGLSDSGNGDAESEREREKGRAAECHPRDRAVRRAGRGGVGLRGGGAEVRSGDAAGAARRRRRQCAPAKSRRQPPQTRSHAGPSETDGRNDRGGDE